MIELIKFDATIKHVLAQEAKAIASIQVGSNFVQAVGVLFGREGRVLTTGMGKAGHIARKFASTLCSIKTPAVYLHPGEAAHGDLGLIQSGDCIVAFSTSGKTREVLDVLRWSRQLGVANIISITAHKESPLRELSDIVIDMGELEEADPLKLVPTVSTTVMLAISDALAVALMEAQEITVDDFGARHHGGYLGEICRGK